MANINDPNRSMADRAPLGNTVVSADRITGDR
jgi:hypothetical protein